MPEFRNLVTASSPEKLVVNDDERVCGPGRRERGEGGGKGRHAGRVGLEILLNPGKPPRPFMSERDMAMVRWLQISRTQT